MTKQIYERKSDETSCDNKAKTAEVDNIKIAILSEVKQREIFRNYLLEYAFENVGYEVKTFLSHKNPFINLLKFKPDILINNGFRIDRDYEKFIVYLKRKFKTLIVTEYAEQVLNKKAADNYTHTDILLSTDVHLAWGKGFAQELFEVIGEEKKIFVAGSPRIDIAYLMGKKFTHSNKYFLKRLIASLSNDDIDYRKPWLIIAGNFSRVLKKKTYYKLTVNEYRNLITKLSKEFRDWEIIYRPHPMENPIESIKGGFSQNVHITKKFPAVIWFCASSASIFWSSTSFVEALLCGSKPIFFVPTSTDFDKMHEKLGIRLTKLQLYCIKDVIYTIKEMQHYPELYDNNLLDKLKFWFGEFDGLSFIRQIYIITQLGKNYSIKPINNFLTNRTINSFKPVYWMSREYGRFLYDKFFQNNQYFVKKQEDMMVYSLLLGLVENIDINELLNKIKIMPGGKYIHVQFN